jgi:type I site-specific restriction endonuclease
MGEHGARPCRLLSRHRNTPEKESIMPSTNNRTTQLAADQALIDGLVKHASDIPSLVLGTQTITNADIVSRIQQLITSAKASAAAHVTWLAAVASDRALRAAQRQFLNDLRQTLRARFSTSPTTLDDFGLTARKAAKPKPATQVASAEKAKATRAARGTKGSKQLSTVTGDVTGVVVTPVKAGAAAPEAPSAPAVPPVASGVSAQPAAVTPKS